MKSLLIKNSRFLCSIVLIVFVLGYLLIRAFHTEFISDETASYWYFVYRGWFWGDQVVWDAANHPLNSFIGHHLYNQFGDVPGILRIGSIISFLFYAYATYQFTGLLQRKSLQILGFIALNTIPYLLEYFAYLRGYGLSMGFFMCSVWFLYRYAKDQKLIHLIASYVFVFVATAANLNILNSTILTVIGVSIIHLTHWKKINWKQHIIVFLGTLFLARITWPLVAFALKLKESGALYYSTLDGIWDMTGKSLSRYILFTDHDVLMYLFLILILLMIYFLWKVFKSEGWKRFTQDAYTWLAFLFFGNLTAVLLMAFFMKVNYPEDRTGMHFVPLFLLLVFQLMQRLKYSEYLLLGFPLSLLLHLSVHSSVFTPEERITNDFYRKVKKELGPNDVLSVYKTMFANWHYLDSHQNGLIHVPHTSMRQGNEADVFIARSDIQSVDSLQNPFLSSEYRVIAKNPTNDHVAYKRVNKRQETLFFQKDCSLLKSQNEFMELLNEPHFFTNQEDVKLKFKFHLTVSEIRQSTDFVVMTMDKNGTMLRYVPLVLELAFQSKKLDKTLQFAVMLDNLKPEETGLKIYLWNRKPGISHTVRQFHLEATQFEQK